jgi:hypothetical protein
MNGTLTPADFALIHACLGFTQDKVTSMDMHRGRFVLEFGTANYEKLMKIDLDNMEVK